MPLIRKVTAEVFIGEPLYGVLEDDVLGAMDAAIGGADLSMSDADLEEALNHMTRLRAIQATSYHRTPMLGRPAIVALIVDRERRRWLPLVVLNQVWCGGDNWADCLAGTDYPKSGCTARDLRATVAEHVGGRPDQVRLRFVGMDETAIRKRRICAGKNIIVRPGGWGEAMARETFARYGVAWPGEDPPEKPKPRPRRRKAAR